MNLAALRGRLAALTARVPTPREAWPEVVFPIVETGPTGRIVTGTLVRDTNTPTGWREVSPNAATQTKGT